MAKEGQIKDEGQPEAVLGFHAALGQKIDDSGHRRGTHRGKRILNSDMIGLLP
jgi:hypothetical protein